MAQTFIYLSPSKYFRLNIRITKIVLHIMMVHEKTVWEINWTQID